MQWSGKFRLVMYSTRDRINGQFQDGNIKLQILENRPESTGEVKAHLHNGVRACRHKQLPSETGITQG